MDDLEKKLASLEALLFIHGEPMSRTKIGAVLQWDKEECDLVIDEMTAAIRHLASTYQARGTLAGVGIGVAGIIDAHSGMLRESPNLPGWSDYTVRAEIEQRLGFPVLLENDANVAAFKEYQKQYGAKYE